MEPNQPKNKRKSPKPCTILKIKTYRKRGQPYTRILNDTLRDQRLGGMARAILAYALSRPSDWKLRSWEVAKEFQCGEFAVRNAMKQLVAAGYARLDLVRAASGQVTGRVWLIRESPELEWPQPRRGFSTLGVSGAHRDVVYRGS